MNVVHVLQQGGVAMVPLLLLSILAMTVTLERTLYFASLEWGGGPFGGRLREFLRLGKVPEAILWLTGLNGAIASIAAAGLAQWDRGKEAMESAIVVRAQEENMELHKHLALLETTVTASPLIGLLGTITGMMGVFRAVSAKMAQNPQADTSSILAGIGEALVATASGILLAVVCLFLHNLFQRLAESQMEKSQILSLKLLNIWDEENGD